MCSGNEDVPSVEEWLSQDLPSGARIGFDPQLMSEHVFKKYSDALETSGQMLVPVTHNLVDAVWGSERPPRPLNPLLVLSMKYSGEESVHTQTHILCTCMTLWLYIETPKQPQTITHSNH